MKIFRNRKNLEKKILNIKNLSFFPTLGGLHEGHSELIKIAKKRFKKVLVSIFVNPKQFNSKRDYKSYPRNQKKDLALLRKLKVDYVYIPSKTEIFSFKTTNKIFLHKFSSELCGKYRKGHFPGVLNVVNRFLEIIKPKYIVLGKKDFQQFFLIKEHILKSKIPTKVVALNTVRNKHGIAYSSRNLNMNKLQLKRYIKVVKLIKRQKKSMDKQKIINGIKKLEVKKVDYIEFLNLRTLKKPKTKKSKFNVFIAIYIDKIRLIDNF